MNYGGFWVRVVAALIDGLLLSLLFAVLNFGSDQQLSGLFTGVVGWLYYAGMESSTRQATLGKSVFGLVVTSTQGQRITFLRATGRYFAKILSALILFIGFIMIAFDPRKQGLHDKLADTLVIQRGR
jgi:uncharacterized RDD family membrane protein YckC